MTRLTQSYKTYIRSDKWKAKRKQALAYYGNRCQVCGTTRRLEVNHLNYSTLFNENLRDLSILCHGHHMEYTRLRRRLSKKKHTGREILGMVRANYIKAKRL